MLSNIEFRFEFRFPEGELETELETELALQLQNNPIMESHAVELDNYLKNI
jgi:hypothetical protein